MTNEEIKEEAEKIVDGCLRTALVTGSQRDAQDTADAAIIALCVRVRDSQREEDTKKCDAIIDENEKRRSHEPAKERRNKIGKVVYGARLCANAIRRNEP